MTPLAVLAQVTRSGFVESVHSGSLVALDASGEAVLAAGDVSAAVLPRSCAKPLQLLAMLRRGLELHGELLALSCSSHSGEAFHLDGVERVLATAGLDPTALRNTPDLPMDDDERLRWLREGRDASSLAQNCSGKHAAMLATCVHNGWDRDTYLDPSHPLQVEIAGTVEELSGEQVAATGVDGCGAPVLAISLTGLARAFATLATAVPGSPEHRVAEAVRRHPQWVGGSRRDVTALLRGVPGLIAKDGAEAVYAAALPDGRAVALKIADGSQRARPVVMAAALRALGVDAAVLDEQATSPVLGHGRPVGSVEPVGSWTQR